MYNNKAIDITQDTLRTSTLFFLFQRSPTEGLRREAREMLALHFIQ